MQIQQNDKTTAKSELWHIFLDMFEKAGFLFLFFFLVYFAVYMAHTQKMSPILDTAALLPASGEMSSANVYIPAVTEFDVHSAGTNSESRLPSVDFSKAPQGKEEIAAYYAAALNRAKANAASVTLVEKRLELQRCCGSRRKRISFLRGKISDAFLFEGRNPEHHFFRPYRDTEKFHTPRHGKPFDRRRFSGRRLS